MPSLVEAKRSSALRKCVPVLMSRVDQSYPEDDPTRNSTQILAGRPPYLPTLFESPDVTLPLGPHGR
jgi:hypothetical protein